MKYPFIALTLSCALSLAAPASAALFDSESDPISPLQYSALLGLRGMDPVLFRDKLMPLIDKAMQDGVITRGELEEIEKAAGNVAQKFYQAAKAPTLEESFNEILNKAGKTGQDLGNKLGETFNDALDLFQNKMKEFKKEEPQPSTTL